MFTSHMIPHGAPELTDMDQVIFRFHANCSYQEEYECRIADRNDYALMLARTTMATIACRATRDNAMPV